MLRLRRLSGRVASFLFGLTLAAALIGSALPLHAKTPRELAEERYQRAQVLLSDLNAVPELELGVKQYNLVADAFRAVHRASPASGYCDNALLEAAHVYARMATRFGDEQYKVRAIKAYRYLISQYPHSKLLGEARDAARALEAGDVAPAALTAAEAPPAAEPVSEPAPAPAPEDAVATKVRYAPTPGSSKTAATAGRIDLAPSKVRKSDAQIDDLRYWRHPEYLRVVVQMNDFAQFKYDALASPPRLYFDLFSSRLSGKLRQGVAIAVKDDPVVSSIRFGQNRQSKARLVLDLMQDAVFDVRWLSNPPRMVLEIRPKNAPLAPADKAAPQIAKSMPLPEPPPSSGGLIPTAHAASLPPNVGTRPGARPAGSAVGSVDPAPTTAAARPPSEAVRRMPLPAAPKPAEAPSRGSQGLIRALGLKIERVVIDAGHGGHDTGMIGPTGLREKDVVLDIALELGRMVEEELGAEVIYTRSDDTYTKPSVRTEVANEAKADLFISVHANASSVRSVRGVETYYLNLTTDAWAMKVASRENAASERSVHELKDLLGKIAQQDRIAESREFATHMQAAVFGGLAKETSGLRNRGVRQAPMIVLIGAEMPAILAEVGFLSNPNDEKLFRDPDYRKKVAELLYEGIAEYAGTLSGHELTMSGGPRAAAQD